MPTDAFTQQEVNNLWEDFLNQLKNNNRRRIYGSLSSSNLQRKSDYQLELELHAQTQQEAFNEVKPELTRFLREQLNNFSLHIDASISATTDAPKLEPYSPEEKYQYLVERNPHIAELKKRLRLDLD